jgi:pimeloyl-ACP methyl ester carboxylesterase
VKRKLARTRELVRGGTSGLLGDTLPPGLRYPERMQLRLQGRDCTPGEIARLYAEQASGRDVVFFVHGLLYDDSCWRAATFDMTSAFERELGMFAVHVLYDTGRHISENGLELANLLQALANEVGEAGAHWHLVAHSMGGLVCRSALFQGDKAGMAFTRRIDRVVLLGTPNRGVPLEKGAQLARLLVAGAPIPLRLSALGLRRLFHSLRLGGRAPLGPIAGLTDFWVYTVPTFFLTLAGRILDMRSDGIRDLRHGAMLREEWEQQPSWGGLKPHRVPVPALPWARTYAIAGSLSARQRTGPTCRATDGLVSAASAANLGPNDELHLVENGRFALLPGVNHFVMPFSREVFDTLRRWFGDPPNSS